MGQTIARNKKAYHDYEILEEYEAGIALKGSEVKAIRRGRVNLKDSFVRIIKGEAFLLNAHISNLETTHSFYRPDERRDRKLLLHRKEIDKLEQRVMKDGLSIVPTSLYLSHKNLVKIKIALARGKKLHDKREDLKRKTANREAQIAMKNHFYK
ncbi:SsrA-binding protein SmpB [Sulfurospirillum sp. 1307]|jgi:SsrA-binding protein